MRPMPPMSMQTFWPGSKGWSEGSATSPTPSMPGMMGLAM